MALGRITKGDEEMSKEQIEIYCEECPSCHLLWWISLDHHERLLQSKETFFCPNGHSQSYSGKTDAQKLREALEEKDKIKNELFYVNRDSNKCFKELQDTQEELKKLKPKKKREKKK